MKIFDFHTHAFPDGIAERTMTLLSEGCGIPNEHDGTFRGLCGYEKYADGFLLLPIATKPSQMRAVNSWAADRAGGGVFAFGSLHPDGERLGEELDYLRARGARGVKMHPEYQSFFVDDERMIPVYQAIFDRDMILILHAGVDLGMPPPIHGNPRRIARLCERFPNGRIVAAHMGGFRQLGEVMECLAGKKNLWMDTSFAAQRLTREEVAGLIKLHGARRFLFATDAPWSQFEPAVCAVTGAGLSDRDTEDILYNNAMELLCG